MSKQALVEIKDAVTKMEPDFRAALPAHIPSAKFIRTAQTALSVNPDIADCDRRSVYASIMKAAQDGLVLDGREAALVKFNSKAGPVCQYMPMVNGLIKKARNSGEISTLNAHVVYEKDIFAYTLGDDEKIDHKPFLGEDRGKPVLVYAVATLKDGGKQRAVLTVGEVNRVRAVSRAKDSGPWVSWWDEMAKKTAIRRLAKYLPSSADRDEFHEAVTRDDELYQPDPAAEPTPAADAATEGKKPGRRTRAAAAVIDATAEETATDAAPQPATSAPATQDEGEDMI
jgi:recombination protein RecT